MSDFHLALSINKALWDDLVGVALPFQIADGAFDLGRNVYQGVKQRCKAKSRWTYRR